MTTNQINFLKSKEEKRHNREMERETRRANVARESISRDELSEKIRATNIQAEHNAKVLAESGRHNVVQEGLTSSYNTAIVSENVRHNQANELLSSKQIALDTAYKSGSLDIQKQANAISQSRADRDYSIAQMQQAEINRHNVALEKQQGKELAESVRYHTQAQLNQYAVTKEQNRHNIATENETARHNAYQEQLNTNVHRLNVLDAVSGEIRRWGYSLGLLKSSGR